MMPFAKRENGGRNKFVLCVKEVEMRQENNQEYIIIKLRCLETSSRNVKWGDVTKVLSLT